MSASHKAAVIRDLLRQISAAGKIIIHELEVEEHKHQGPTSPLPSKELYDARRIVQAACGMCIDIIQDPLYRLYDVACTTLLARSLHIAAETRIADVIDEGASDYHTGGVAIDYISERVGIASRKLAQILRCLCSTHIFTEVKPGYFANNETSCALVRNEPLRAIILVHGMHGIYEGIGKLPSVLVDSNKSVSLSMYETAFQEGVGQSLSLWEYYEMGSRQPDGSWKPRPELDTFSVGMVGNGKFVAPSICAGYPWASLGSAKVVDVGGGVGSMCMELAKHFPELRFVVQDRAPVIARAKDIWNQEIPDATKTGRTELVAHDFFEEQPCKDADIYFLRYILHNWPDDECIKILKQLREAMKPGARILVADMVLHTTVESSSLQNAPAPLLPNYGKAHLHRNIMDLTMLMLFNTSERTPEQFRALATRAGLEIVHFWECRSHMCIVEMVTDPNIKL